MIQSDKCAFIAGFLDLPRATGFPGAQWEDFQLALLNNTERFGIDVKSRQIAWSFTTACDAVADGVLNPETPHIFVSINLEEAKEKIRYAKAIIESLDAPVRPKMIQDSQTGIEFENHSRLVSFPCRPPRGMPRARIYLDEMAHYKEGLDREIYTAALPATTRGDGYIRIGSSPLGAKGLFWEIYTESTRKYPGFAEHRSAVPWWQVRAFCADKRRAIEQAPLMSTRERVVAFGTDALRQIFENMFLEDFAQEHECQWMDEQTAWITWELIQKNQDTELLTWKADGIDEARAMLPEVLAAIRTGTIESAYAGGIDVGRKHDTTEFFVVGKSTTGQRPLRFAVTLRKTAYDDQEACLADLISALPMTSVLVDQNGIGAQLAENLSRTGRAQGVDFTNANKELWAVEARVQCERGNAPIPQDRELAYQIHSIKKLVTAAKNVTFDAERNASGHADKFWAWALALWAANTGIEPAAEAITEVNYHAERKSRWGFGRR